MRSAEPFPPTRCSILERLSSSDDQVRDAAYDVLVRAYWQPIYAYVRLRWRLEPADAQDATQSFLAAAFDQEYFTQFDADKARFRTFLRVCLDRFVMKQRQAESAVKRGGGAHHVALDFSELESGIADAPADVPDENALFRREYVRSLFARAVSRLRDELNARDRAVVYRVFELYDLAGNEATYDAIGRELGITSSQVTNHLHAARRRFRDIVLDEIRATSGTDAEYREEVRDVLGIDLK